jgi:chromate reductase
MRLSHFDDLASVPLFNEDVEARGLPPAVEKMCAAVRAADALLVATPEYNQSIPGVLKNAIDWLSRPGAQGVLEGKLVGVIGVTAGQWGTRLAQAALRQVLFATESVVVPGTALYLRDAARLFDAQGELRDAAARDALSRYLAEFAAALQASRTRASGTIAIELAQLQPVGSATVE